MIRTKLAIKVLTPAEQEHLSLVGIHSMKNMKEQIEDMNKRDWKDGCFIGCVTCWEVGKKLGLWTTTA